MRQAKPTIQDYFETHPLEIVEELLSNMWDVEKFVQFFETDVEFVTDEHTINYNIFLKSLDYIRVINIKIEESSEKLE